MADNYDQLLDTLYASLPKKQAASGERFEIPPADSFNEGSKTIIRNFDGLCAKLRRTPAEVSRFLFKELAVPGEIQQGGRLLLHGKFYPKLVNEKITDYCKSQVLCSQCGKPDTHLKAGQSARHVAILVCEACGATNSVKV